MRQPFNFTFYIRLRSSNHHTHHGRPVADKAVGRPVADRLVADRQAVGKPVAGRRVVDKPVVGIRRKLAVDSNLCC